MPPPQPFGMRFPQPRAVGGGRAGRAGADVRCERDPSFARTFHSPSDDSGVRTRGIRALGWSAPRAGRKPRVKQSLGGTIGVRSVCVTHMIGCGEIVFGDQIAFFVLIRSDFVMS
ncbi:hypothetical protein GCM10027563_29180 [Parasphingorhabdus pacifica]